MLTPVVAAEQGVTRFGLAQAERAKAFVALPNWSGLWNPVGGLIFDPGTADPKGNNAQQPTWGKASTQFVRVAPPNYADGVSAMVSGPAPRAISNRVFNDLGQNIFSENDVSQWGWAWGQFLDHDMDLRDETAAESASMTFDAADPLESFRNDTGQMDFSRTLAAPGTGATTPRQQIDTISSFLDASQVYGTTASRLASDAML